MVFWDKPKVAEVPAPPPAPVKHMVGDNNTAESWQTSLATTACDRKSDIEQMIEFAAAKDEVAFNRFYYDVVLVQRRCITLAKGTKVFISDVSIFGGTRRVRVRGETNYHYVSSSMLEAIMQED